MNTTNMKYRVLCLVCVLALLLLAWPLPVWRYLLVCLCLWLSLFVAKVYDR